VRARRWSLDQLPEIVKSSTSYREAMTKLGLVPAGGNYSGLKAHIQSLGIDTSHFHRHPWNKGKRIPRRHIHSLESVLTEGSGYQSYKLKRRLFAAELKEPRCELCGWAERAPDGRIPLELDHINGRRDDNRLSNLRILCPNCHSLQGTHRGLNISQRKPR
jgi:hypothetical protein